MPTSVSESRMHKLVTLLNDAAKRYYTSAGDESSLTDAQYDRYLAELEDLEAQAGYKLAESPTIKVGYEEDEDRIKHYSPILSLKSTKNVDELLYFLGVEEGVLSWKLDGVSIILYYQNGKLDRAVSRGDGMFGKDITKNVILMRHVPLQIGIKSTLIVRGEGCMSIKDFDQLKATKEGENYRNPRNLAAGLINSTKTSNVLVRHMSFVVHSIIYVDGFGRDFDTREEEYLYLDKLGFYVVPYIMVVNYKLKEAIELMTSTIDVFEYPVDGLVLAMNDIAYGASLGQTQRYPKDILAFKWPDKSVLTKVKGMKWSVSQTGLITPVVVVEPVDLEGTTVQQANLHSLKIFEGLGIGKGDILEIYKANKIIPEVAENLTRSATEDYPHHCPDCGGETTVVDTGKTRKLYCYACAKTNGYF